MSDSNTQNSTMIGCGIFALLALIAACIAGAMYFLKARPAPGDAPPVPGEAAPVDPAPVGPAPVAAESATTPPVTVPAAPTPVTPTAVTATPVTPTPVAPAVATPVAAGGPKVTIGIAYGTEKQRWLEWAVSEFAKTADGGRITVNLLPMGSLEGAQAAVGGDTRIHVWSPASPLYRDVFIQEWGFKHGGNPILSEESLALSPMVFVFWKERHDAFITRHAKVNFKTLGEGLATTGGWGEIAGKPEWGLMKVGHTHPNQSNSGIMTLVLMAHHFHGKQTGLTMADIIAPEFQKWMQAFESGVSGLSHSTGTMMRDMVLRGPSSYDALVVYENVVIDYLKNAEGRWGQLRVVYPEYNMWNDNPYIVLNAPWSTPAHREACTIFQNFLLSEPIQKQALVHGFRPGNPAVAINGADSPFVRYQPYGLQIELTKICAPPSAEVINNLLASWQRSQGRR